MLGLELQLEGGRLRFWAGHALLLESEEMIEQLRARLDGVQRRVDEEARQLAKEVSRREEAERRLTELQGELERLKAHGE